ncbi:MAG: peptidylprolyl isomerase [Devosia sp.]
MIEFGARVAGEAGTADSAVPPNKVKLPAPPPKPDKPIVSVNGVAISRETISAEAQQHPASSPAEAFREAARALVVRELLLGEARSLGMAAEPAKDGKGRRETDDDALIRALLDQRIESPKADIAACRRYYDSNPGRFVSDTVFEARHILVAAPLDDGPARKQARATAQSLIDELTRDPSRFAKLARQHSACPSKEQGGNLGQLTQGSTVPEFETVLKALEAGQMSPVPAPTRFGYHVIQLDRVIAGSRLPFAAVRDRIAVYLEASSWSRAVSQYIGILAGKADIRGIDIGGVHGALVR